MGMSMILWTSALLFFYTWILWARFLHFQIFLSLSRAFLHGWRLDNIACAIKHWLMLTVVAWYLEVAPMQLTTENPRTWLILLCTLATFRVTFPFWQITQRLKLRSLLYGGRWPPILMITFCIPTCTFCYWTLLILSSVCSFCPWSFHCDDVTFAVALRTRI